MLLLGAINVVLVFAIFMVNIVQSRYAVLIAANSEESILYIYEWSKNASTGSAVPMLVQTSAPTTQSISVFVGNTQNIQLYLSPLLAFAVQQLTFNSSIVSEIPIYFKSTGVMRLMSNESSSSVTQAIISVLSDKSFCPFLFFPGFAHILSGNEQAAASWISVNIFQNTNLARKGFSYVNSPPPITYGVIDMDATSLQVAFLPSNSPVLDDSFTVNLGEQNVWNIYATSYLDLGYSTAIDLHLRFLADKFYVPPDSAVVPTMLDYCFYSGYTENVENTNGTLTVQIWGPAVPAGNQLDLCMSAIQNLLGMEGNMFCDIAYPQQCAFSDKYQPQTSGVVSFIGTSALQFSWIYLNLPSSATIQEFMNAAYPFCSMSFNDVMSYYESNPNFIQIPDISLNLPYFCFINSYIISVLTTGLGFPLDREIYVPDMISPTGWELGSIMMDINILPINETPTIPEISSNLMWTYIFLGLNFGIIIGIVVSCNIARILFVESKNQRTSVIVGSVNVIQNAPSVPPRQLYDDIEINGSRSSLPAESLTWTSLISQYSPFGGSVGGSSGGKRVTETKQSYQNASDVPITDDQGALLSEESPFTPISDRDKTFKRFQYS
jgi:hypothetical protein